MNEVNWISGKKRSLMTAVVFCLSLILYCGILRAEPSLVGHWSLDEGEGGVAKDSSANINDGRIVNGVWSKSKEGVGLELIAESSSYVTVPSQPELNLTNELTVSAWVWPINAFGVKAIVSKGNRTYATGYNFGLVHNKLAFCRKPEGSPGLYCARWSYSAPVIEPKTWSYVACSYDATSGKVIFYHNGVRLNEVSLETKKIAYTDQECPLVIGAMGQYPRNYWKFSGFIKEVKLYNLALAPEEIEKEFLKSEGIASLKLETEQERYERTLTSKVKGKIFDADINKPLNTRVYLQGEDGSYYYPGESFHYGKNTIYFYAFGNFEAKVKPGKLTLTVLHGFEYEPRKITFQAEGGKEASLEIGLKRFANMPSLGWYGSDHEVQYWGHASSTPYQMRMGLRYAAKIFQAEGLNHIHSPYLVNPKDKQLAPSLQTSDFVADLGVETHTLIDGDVVCLNISSCPGLNNIYNLPMIEQVKKEGGLAIPTHVGVYGNAFESTGNKNIGRFFPVYVALRKSPIYNEEPRSFDMENDIVLRNWYRYLNLGFKLSISGSTDCYIADPPKVSIPGRNRTYVRADKLSVSGICEGYRKGRTFFTMGPLLTFEVEGKEIGDTVFLDGAKPIRASFRAYSLSGLGEIQLVKNGDVVKTISGEGKKKVEEEFSIRIDHTCWLAVRCVSRKDEFFGNLAHTSPIYIQVGEGKMKPKKEDVEYYLNWISRLRDFTNRWLEVRKNNKRYMTQWEELSSGYYEAIDDAEVIYKSLLDNPRDWNMP